MSQTHRKKLNELKLNELIGVSLTRELNLTH